MKFCRKCYENVTIMATATINAVCCMKQTAIDGGKVYFVASLVLNVGTGSEMSS